MNVNAEPPCLSGDIFANSTSLIYGIGNVGRQDDGLGWAFVDRLEQCIPALPAHLRRTYQLGFEDADLISRYARVLFIDATKDPAVESFTLSRPEPELDLSFTSHAISVRAILATTLQCFGQIPDAYLLAIRGYEWELQEGLTGPRRKQPRGVTGPDPEAGQPLQSTAERRECWLSKLRRSIPPNRLVPSLGDLSRQGTRRAGQALPIARELSLFVSHGFPYFRRFALHSPQ